jgi:invasion protein IalB
MTIRIVSAPARPVRWSLVTTVAAALAVLAVPAVQAQAPAPAPTTPATKPKPEPKKPAAPKTPAAQPAQAQQAPAPQQPAQAPAPQQQQAAAPPPAQMPNFVYSPWTKFCGPPPSNGQPPPNQKLMCFTGKDARTEQGVPIIAAALVEMDGEPQKTFRITLPFGLSVSQGTRLIVDQNQPLAMPFMTCAPLSPNMGCIAQYDATPDLVTKLKKGQMLTIQAINLQNQIVSFPLALADFQKANEGPATDPKKYEEEQKKTQEELQKKADELRKKLEQQGGAPAAPK